MIARIFVPVILVIILTDLYIDLQFLLVETPVMVDTFCCNACLYSRPVACSKLCSRKPDVGKCIPCPFRNYDISQDYFLFVFPFGKGFSALFPYPVQFEHSVVSAVRYCNMAHDGIWFYRRYPPVKGKTC